VRNGEKAKVKLAVMELWEEHSTGVQIRQVEKPALTQSDKPRRIETCFDLPFAHHLYPGHPGKPSSSSRATTTLRSSQGAALTSCSVFYLLRIRIAYKSLHNNLQLTESPPHNPAFLSILTNNHHGGRSRSARMYPYWLESVKLSNKLA